MVDTERDLTVICAAAEPRELESDPRPLMIDSVDAAAYRAGRAQVTVPHSLLSRPMHAAARRALPGRGPDWLSRRNDEAPHPPDGRPTRTPAAWLSLYVDRRRMSSSQGLGVVLHTNDAACSRPSGSVTRS